MNNQIENAVKNIEENILRPNCDAYIISYLLTNDKQKEYNNYGNSTLYGELPDVEKLFEEVLSNLIDTYRNELSYNNSDICDKLDYFIGRAMCRL